MPTPRLTICKVLQLSSMMLLSVSCVGAQGFGVEPETVMERWDRERLEFQRKSQQQADQETPEARIVRLKRELKEAEAAVQADRNKSTSPRDIPTGALVVVSSDKSEGSGFIGELQGRPFFITNIHVLGAAREARFMTIDDVEVPLGSMAFLSKRRDIAIVPITWDGPVLEISPSLNFDEVAIGDAVTVMGNTSGVRVAKRIKGKVRGLGPDEIEISAKFAPGNSGSPIIHDELGSVVGVASHMPDLSAKSKWTEDSDIRRFGYRLDGDIEWEQVSLRDLHNQAEVYHRFEDRTIVMGRIGYMLEHESTLMTHYREHESLGYMFDRIDSSFSWKRGTNSSQNQMLLKRFINNMITELQRDREDTRAALRINFYLRRYQEIEASRDYVRRSLQRFSEVRL